MKEESFNRKNHCSLFLIDLLAVALYNGPLLRWSLPEALQASHKLELLKLQQKPGILLKGIFLRVGASNLNQSGNFGTLLKINSSKKPATLLDLKACNFIRIISFLGISLELISISVKPQNIQRQMSAVLLKLRNFVSVL